MGVIYTRTHFNVDTKTLISVEISSVVSAKTHVEGQTDTQSVVLYLKFLRFMEITHSVFM